MLACLYVVTVLFTDFVGPLDELRYPWASKAITVKGKRVDKLDFGIVEAGCELHHEFKITNLWAVRLKIHAQASSDCVKVMIEKDTLRKNETVKLQIDMDGRRFHGPKSVNVLVTLIDDSPLPKFQSTATLQILATTPTPVKPVKEKPATIPAPVVADPVAPSNLQTNVCESCLPALPNVNHATPSGAADVDVVGRYSGSFFPAFSRSPFLPISSNPRPFWPALSRFGSSH